MRRIIILLLLLVIALGSAGAVWAHGVKITYTVTFSPTIAIEAAYDTGEPMANAQVIVYAPDDPKTPWLTGECDDDGRFSFSPDPSKPGTWEIQVRQAGHGEWLKIPLDEEMMQSGQGVVTEGGDEGFSTAQIVLMSACVIWGFVGTALFFQSRRPPAQEPGEAA
ncbi:MAG: carboxypeptidase regulatory-like domain-containing protein [Anaerolineae bacterium]|jgi:nickel transport protein|nr:carboxypeptidase regulatory-like domain-containing protein [Anaerolineae bacterium]